MEQKHRILREVLRNYLTFKELCSQTGEYVIEYGPYKLSFLDLQDKLQNLAPRKKEALFYNVILDWKQKDVAKKMGITTVSVGQYVEQATLQLSKAYWADVDPEEEKEFLFGNNFRKELDDVFEGTDLEGTGWKKRS